MPSRYSPSFAVTSLLSQMLLLGETSDPALRTVCLVRLITGSGAEALHRRIPYRRSGSLDLGDDILYLPVIEVHNDCVVLIQLNV